MELIRFTLRHPFDLGKLMKTHKVVGLYSGDSYFSGTLDECETYVAYEPADSFKIVPL